MNPLIGVLAVSPDDEALAATLGARLGLSQLEATTAARDYPPGGILLAVQDGIPALHATGRRAPGAIVVGFEDEALAHRRRAGHNELLGRAVGWRQSRAPKILDATAGFARDAFLLADLGCDVILCERQPLMAMLLDEALRRARDCPNPWLNDVASRMHLHSDDAREFRAAPEARREVIYLDPMFPHERKAAPGKEMQLLQQLVVTSDSLLESDSAELLRWALQQDVKRVVVKRPLRAPTLGDCKPGHSLKGRAVRFDVYPCRAQ